MKKQLLKSMRMLLVAALLGVGVSNVWAYDITLTSSYAVDNYSKAFYVNFQDKSIDDATDFATAFTYSSDFTQSAERGLQNTGGGTRTFTFTKSLTKGQLIIIEAGQTGTHGMTVSVSSTALNPIKNDGYYAFYVTEDVTTSVTITLGRLNYILAMQVLTPSNDTYTVNAVTSDGTFLKEIATGTYTEDAKVYYPYGIMKDGVCYSKASNGSGDYWGFTNIAAGLRTIVYSATDWAYYSEAEDMNNGSSLLVSQGDYPSRFSYGIAKRLPSNGSLYSAALSAGTYSVTVYGRNYKNNSQGGISVKVRNTSGALSGEAGRFDNWGSGASSEKTVTGIVVPEGCYINICQDSWNSNIDIDYVRITKTSNDVTVSKTITDAGWATYCSPYALDLENATGLTEAYIVTGGDGGVLTKTSVKGGTVPANTGLLLQGDEGTATIPVVASSSTDVSSSIMTGVTSATEIAAGTGWVLMGSPSLGFYKNTNAFTVGANTAYIPLANLPEPSPVRGFFLLDGSDATGIGTALMNKEAMNSEVYNLQGQRVAAPTKGLYIVNGKKAIVK